MNPLCTSILVRNINVVYLPLDMHLKHLAQLGKLVDLLNLQFLRLTNLTRLTILTIFLFENCYEGGFAQILYIYSDLPNKRSANLIIFWGKKHLQNLFAN